MYGEAVAVLNWNESVHRLSHDRRSVNFRDLVDAEESPVFTDWITSNTIPVGWEDETVSQEPENDVLSWLVS